MEKKMLLILSLWSSFALSANETISKTSPFIATEHEGNRVTIERKVDEESTVDMLVELQPMQIGEVTTVGELEVLAFIKKAKKDVRLMLIDARTKRWYHKETIASAMNLPFSLLDEESAYQKKIVTLLGGVYSHQTWDFSSVNTLLIFGNGIRDIQAVTAVKSLLKLGYPTDKLLYYRGGIESWKSVNLSVVH